MQTLAQGYRGITLLIDINWDRIYYIGVILTALGLGGAVGSLF